jgi:hypothetical protein
MSQHDYVIDNQSAPAARADLNNVLAAIRTVNSGPTAPASTAADMLWYETDTFTLWKRNAGNSAWVSLGVFDETNSKFNPNQTFATLAEAQAGTNNTRAMTPLRVSQAIDALTSTVNYQVFTATGTWTKPDGISADAVVIVEAWGAGGGGGRNAGSSSSSGGGGGGGGYMTRSLLASDLGATVPVTVGAGGAAGGGSGIAGGSSSFGTHLVADGGEGGISSGSASGGNGGPGGDLISTGSSVYHDGGDGGTSGSVGVSAVIGAGGGGSATTSSVSGAQIAGGTSVGAGAGGYGGRNVVAQAGFAPGGGGGGSCGSSGSAAAGARGEVHVWTIG